MRAWILGEFSTPEACVKATASLREQGHTELDTYSPYPLHGSSEAMGLPKSKVPLFALMGGLAGAVGAYSLEWFTTAMDYPINVGGRAMHAFPSYIPITFELGVLLAAFSIFFGLLFLMRLPQPYHPVFEFEQFTTASSHAFWVSVETDKVEQDESRVSETLRRNGASHVAVWKEPVE